MISRVFLDFLVEEFLFIESFDCLIDRFMFSIRELNVDVPVILNKLNWLWFFFAVKETIKLQFLIFKFSRYTDQVVDILNDFFFVCTHAISEKKNS